MIAIHPLGLLIALIFAGSMGGLIWWMFRIPPYLPAPVAKAVVSVEAIKRILVPTVGTQFAGREVELACRLGREQKAEILLAYLLEVPRTLPLEAPLPTEESKAREALQLAKTIVDLHDLSSTMEVLRSRIAGEKIIQVAREKEVDLIIVGIKSGMEFPYEDFARTINILLKKSPCELLISRVAEEARV